MLRKMIQHTAIAIALAASAIPMTTLAQSGANTPPGGGVGTASFDCGNGTFSFGGGATQFSTCVSSHGNVASFKVQNSEHLQGGTPAEGYIVCATLSSGVKVYHDVMFSEAGWGAAVASTPGSLPITINRTTTDGAFTLTQKYAKDNTERDFTITMTLKANVPAVSVKLVRVADLDVDTIVSGNFTNHFDASLDSVWASQTRAMTATALTYGVSHYASYNGFATSCDQPAAGAAFDGDAGAALQYNLGSLSAGKAKTVKVAYRGM